eukprot:RCo008896
MAQLRGWLGVIVSLLLLGLALGVLYNLDHEYRWNDVVTHVKDVPVSVLFRTALFTFLNYILLTGYDWMAIRQVGAKIPYPKIALTSFIGYTFSNTLGFSLLTGASVRYRFYTAAGLKPAQIARVIVFCSVTFFLGLFLVGGISLLLGVKTLPAALPVPFWISSSLQAIGGVCAAIAVGYFLLSLLYRKPLVWRHHSWTLPSAGQAASQLLVASCDWLLAGAIFYSLLPSDSGVSYWSVLAVFVAANLIGLLAHIPGGLGIFESIVTLVLSPFMLPGHILGALILFRVIYYLLPFLLGLALFVGIELLQHKAKLKQWLAPFQGLSLIVPPLLSLAVFIAGTVLLFSGATPAVASRLFWLQGVLPLPLLEVSHLAGSLIGFALLLLAHSLQRRYDTAYTLTSLLLAGGIVFSLLKGLDWEEASLSAIILACLLPCRHLFYRKGVLQNEPFSLKWMLAILAVLFGTFWLIFFSYKHVEYRNELWWEFTLFHNAPRAMRAGVLVAIAACGYGLQHLLRSSRIHPDLPTADEQMLAFNLVQKYGRTQGYLALLGDKYLLFHPDREAFLMYGIEGRSWIVLGDPIGPETQYDELLWQFRELCDSYDAWPVFYEVGSEYLPHYLELGLSPLKLGEEAIINLATFTLEGSARKSLRQTYAKTQRDGLSFQWVEAADVYQHLPLLQAISDAWMGEKQVREKGFSVGRFDTDYLCRCPLALALCHGEPVGFANVWTTENKSELSIDLMRYDPERSPGGVMDFLFIELLQWGKAQGYRTFNLGMAPMSGLSRHPLAPFWNKLGQLLFAKGDRFYNFQGLRRFKEKYQPRWRPCYLVSQGGFRLPAILANTASLISRGMLGTIRK